MLVRILLALLAVQLLITVVVWLPAGQWGGDDAPTGFFQLDTAQVQSVRITESNTDNSLSVSLDNGTWWLGYKLPANDQKAKAMIDKIAKAGQTDWPVGTTASARNRFEVADDNYQRLLNFMDEDGNSLLELYLGTSPSFNRVHVRLKDEDTIYAINFSNHEASLDKDDWLDKGLLKPTGSLRSIAIVDKSNWTLKREGGKWQSTGGEPDQTLADEFASRFANLNVLGFVENPSLKGAQKLQFQLVDDQGTHEISFLKTGEDSNVVVQSNRYDVNFEVGGYLFGLLEESIDSLTKPPAPEAEESSDEQAEGS